MKNKYIYVKRGEYRADLFGDLTQAVNSKPKSSPDAITVEEKEQLGFFVRMDYTMRLFRDVNAPVGEPKFVIANYTVDPLDVNDQNTFARVDTEKMMRILDEGYEYALLSILLESPVVPDYGTLQNVRYLVRDPKTRELKDYDTGESMMKYSKMGSVIFNACFVAMVKVGDLPIYYMMLDDSILKISGGLDYIDKDNNTVYQLVDDHDGTVKENIFTPNIVEDDIAVVGKFNVFVEGDTFTLDFFSGKQVFSAREKDAPKELPPVVIDSSFPHTVDGTKIKFDVDSAVGYVKVRFDVGAFFNIVGRKEAPEFEYMVYKK